MSQTKGRARLQKTRTAPSSPDPIKPHTHAYNTRAELFTPDPIKVYTHTYNSRAEPVSLKSLKPHTHNYNTRAASFSLEPLKYHTHTYNTRAAPYSPKPIKPYSYNYNAQAAPYSPSPIEPYRHTYNTRTAPYSPSPIKPYTCKPRAAPYFPNSIEPYYKTRTTPYSPAPIEPYSYARNTRAAPFSSDSIKAPTHTYDLPPMAELQGDLCTDRSRPETATEEQPNTYSFAFKSTLSLGLASFGKPPFPRSQSRIHPALRDEYRVMEDQTAVSDCSGTTMREESQYGHHATRKFGRRGESGWKRLGRGLVRKLGCDKS